jgi:CheY-like chemotaxis protein
MMVPMAAGASPTTDDCFDLDFTQVGRLPAIARAAPPAPAPAPPPAASRSRTNLVCYARAGRGAGPAEAPVLIVEDHEGSRSLLEKILRLHGHAVRAAGENREMARALREPPLPKLILLDVGLPRVDGYTILTHLRAHPQTSAIPVVLVTARAGQADVIRGLTLGAEGYVSKPVSVSALRTVLETVLWKP